MAGSRFALPIKLLIAAYMTVLHTLCVCGAGGAGRVVAGPTARTAQSCCPGEHDGARHHSAGHGENHRHDAACQHCGSMKLSAAGEVAPPAIVFLPVHLLMPPASGGRLVESSVPLRGSPSPRALSSHPPLPPLQQTTVLRV